MTQEKERTKNDHGGHPDSQAKMMNKSMSDSSIVSTMAHGAHINNQIETHKIERIHKCFDIMKKDDNIMRLVMVAMKELKHLIPSQSIQAFVLDGDFAKGFSDIEEASGG